MTKGRLEAFSDGVFAVIITIMVLEIKVPHGGELRDLEPLYTALLGHALSFIFVGIYWVNHHHLLHATSQVKGGVLWANLHLLFWLSMVPWATGWVGEYPAAAWPAATYGAILFLAALSWMILQRALIVANGPDSTLARAVGKDVKGLVSAALMLSSIGLAFVRPWLSESVNLCVAAIWFIPDRRIEIRLAAE